MAVLTFGLLPKPNTNAAALGLPAAATGAKVFVVGDDEADFWFIFGLTAANIQGITQAPNGSVAVATDDGHMWSKSGSVGASDGTWHDAG